MILRSSQKIQPAAATQAPQGNDAIGASSSQASSPQPLQRSVSTISYTSNQVHSFTPEPFNPAVLVQHNREPITQEQLAKINELKEKIIRNFPQQMQYKLIEATPGNQNLLALINASMGLSLSKIKGAWGRSLVYEKFILILEGIKNNTGLPPIDLDQRGEIENGFHRYAACSFLGYTHIWARIIPAEHLLQHNNHDTYQYTAGSPQESSNFNVLKTANEPYLPPFRRKQLMTPRSGSI